MSSSQEETDLKLTYLACSIAYVLCISDLTLSYSSYKTNPPEKNLMKIWAKEKYNL